MMHLHENPKLFRDAVLASAQQFNIQEIYIEKDYWVTVALEAIFKSDMSGEGVFKGGTALSKCHHLVERFSEDIDIVVLRHEGETDNKLKSKIREISKLVGKIIPETEMEGVTNKLGQIRKTVHCYDRQEFKGLFGQVREYIALEVTWLGNFEPSVIKQVDCYIAQMMKLTGQTNLIEEYGLQPFEVQVLTKERTLCEKIMSLVRFSLAENPYEDLANKIRHIYDIHMLLKDKETVEFFDSDEFEVMLNQVGRDDIKSFKNNNAWLTGHPAQAIIFASVIATWDKIKTPYRTTFRDLVTGKLPDEQELIDTLTIVAARLKQVKWSITAEMVKR
ncbi:nucleotidyl transferase AbiEii/AbiGii toxin family protein [Mucilaginibacter sp. 10I4]|uniref:nucleotidyl transferase AbiEii/AbiGii toxin family protein n=1 Tax=Mucilaginibacter sp. 10I4 TaxID=3048580 RepID=UPI002B22B80E|nr:nucleotidyl transferase AbiEii/AbiGii toxin family protein [Mucilaginibacter sp. 10I4]MEB0262055.1 nucleotidyl transferase AbiEii/AbiGii toxin family protein [Mucilaginibacter sp. 10I4]